MWQRIFRENSSRTFVIISLILILLVIPLTIITSKKPQENRTRATASSTLSFLPASSTSNPIISNIGATIPLDIHLEPGTNLVSLIKLDITYDPTKFSVTPTSLVVNSSVFPVTLSSPAVSNGHITATYTIGSDPTKAIQAPVSVGTLTLTVLAPASGSNVIFSTGTQALSLGFEDQASENVLASSTPAVIDVATPTPTPTLSPTPTIVPSSTPTFTPTPTLTSTPIPTSTPTPTITLTPTPISTKVTMTLFLHNIGNSGDNVNPSLFTTSNKNPLHPIRNISFFVYDANAQLVLQQNSTLNYNSASGNFTGSIDLGQPLTGRYSLYVKTDSFLRRLIADATLAPSSTINLPSATLVAGDVVADNALNILDYNVFIDCAGGSASELPIVNPNSQYNQAVCISHADRINSDLNDDGLVNHSDLTLFLRELSVQYGQ